MKSPKNFVSGILVGTVTTIAATAGLVAAVKKQVIAPIEDKEEMIEVNRKKANRKSFAR